MGPLAAYSAALALTPEQVKPFFAEAMVAIISFS